MRSQLRFVMHSSDEFEFAGQILADDSVLLIDGPRWKGHVPETFRSLENISGDYCIIWSAKDCAALRARYVNTCNDWYCESEYATIQFIRSKSLDSVVTEGCVSVNTTEASQEEASGVERRFKLLARFIKKHYTNSVVHWSSPSLPFAPASPGRSANPSKPDAQVWVGPHALRWLKEDQARCVKQFAGSLVEARLVEGHPEVVRETRG